MEVYNIKRVLVQYADGSMILGRDVIDEYGRVLISAGVFLREEIRVLLAKHEITSIWIKDDSCANQEIATMQNLVSASTRLKMTYSVQNAFYSQYGVAAHLPQLSESVQQVVDDLTKRDNVLIYLNDVRFKSDYLFMHSTNVGIFAIVIGIKLGLEKDDLFCLGMGALLHDYGKTRINKAILEKKGSLTWDEFNKVKEHSLNGYTILKSETQFDHRMMLIALQHHEWHDGRGYPWGISGEDIHPFSRIVAVADVYDALTTDRVYRQRIPTHEAVRMICQGAGSQFDGDIVQAFCKATVPYEIGSSVKLNNGLYGSILRLNSADTARPILWTAQGTVNMLHSPELHIVASL
ncbi:MAG: metal dependent phosphohydrolase [Firmicutes bacterium]|nr:metal dependent phosphohydrolase [Bacillota bacterium]